MTTDLENLLPSQETPVEYVTTKDGTVAKQPSVCVKTKKKIKLKKKSTKGNWINSIASFILEQELDGVEIVYRWPETSEDRKNFALFVRELRYKFARVEKIAKRKVPYIISIYSPTYNWATKDVSLLDDIRNYVDFFNVETDNFYAPYHKNNIMTGPLSPLYSLGNDDKSIDRTMEKYTCKTMKPSQLNIILSFGGVHWENVHKSSAEPDDIHFYVRGRDYSGYHFSWRYLKFFGFDLNKASFHDVAKTPYIWDKNHQSFVTFENERSLEEKMEYILSKNLGGVAIDRIDKDDDSHTLLNAVTSMNMCSGPKFAEDEIKYNCEKL
ncbi:hypothetical protein CAEBREN_13398 [Caenorhabditis brenneri]|uniref:GH18 domain-containing protein n=1 Tax=Caenorhabditis brenneri TaxID=135651 RepID=G0NN59_CAEBE|nr:hypothetical protein CAEBREN_13398 [Caenorhabditis brenneri]